MRLIKEVDEDYLMMENKGDTGAALMRLALLISLMLIALRADGVVELRWYWLTAPMWVSFVFVFFAAYVAAILAEMRK